ncbi:hypothetical protein F8388_019351 [Cannabis sativa]|uniref:Uncharacterized protein n=1 Tax=Cannabis sativa TaxID=3483 RepID=A0A7J6FTN7_CANSA|nr:hypothetical protein F8388_019351 [Cannabis sativa]
MNLKEIVLRRNLYGTRETSICGKGPEYVTAQDILPSSVEIVDNTHHITNLTEPINLCDYLDLGLFLGRDIKGNFRGNCPRETTNNTQATTMGRGRGGRFPAAPNQIQCQLCQKLRHNSEGQPLHDFSSDASPRIQAPTITVAPQKTQIPVSHSFSVLTSSVGQLTEPIPTSVAPAVPVVARTTPIVPSELPS